MLLPGPMGWNADHRLKPSTQGIDSRKMATRFTATAFFRLQPHMSMAKEMMFSNTAMTVDRAAKDRNTKNRAPHSRPRGISLKMLGRVMKIRDAPWLGATPKAEQAGKMIRPATKATKVSRMPMRRASPARAYWRPI